MAPICYKLKEVAASQDILEFVLFEFVSGYEEHEDENMITGTMQHVPRVTKVRQVSLGGASARELTRDELLGRVAQQRAVRSFGKQATASALLIQRVWRGRTIARQAAAQARTDWDKQFFLRHGEYQNPISADAISNQMLRPLFMFLRHSSCFDLHQTQEGAEDAGRLATCFRVLLQSIHNPDMRYNYCDLSVGFPDKMSKWIYQARQLLRLACAALGKKGHEFEPKASDNNHITLEASNLAGLAIRVIIGLTDSGTWKCFDEPGQEFRKRKAHLVVLGLLEWLASGSGGLYLAVQSYILANFPVPGIKDDHARSRGKKDKFIITASIITITLRPLLVLSAECSRDRDDEKTFEDKDYTTASNRAAAQFSAHILTIPFLPQRLPQPLLPALQHPSALSPCLRCFGVPIRNMIQAATTSSALPSLSSQQGKVDCKLAGVPLSAWALSNLVCLSSHTVNDNARFVNGLICQEYVQALCCLIEDLNPWVESTRKRKMAEKSANEEEDDRDVEDNKIIRIRNETSKTRETIIFQLLVESLRPLHQQWHLLQLMNEAALNDSAPMVFLVAKRLPKGDTDKLFSQSDVARLYSNLLPAFSVLNPFGGALPILNLLAFTPGILPQLWDWLQTSPGLAHLLNLDYFQGEPSIERCVETQLSKTQKELYNSKKRSTGGRLAAALGWKSRSKSACFAGSNNSFIVDNRSSGRAPERQEFLPGRSSIGGVSLTRTFEQSGILPPRRSVDRVRRTPRRSPVGRPNSDTPRPSVDQLVPTFRDERLWRSDVISDRPDTIRFLESPRVLTRQGASVDRRAVYL